MGKGTFFVPAAHGWHPVNTTDLEGVEPSGPSRAERVLMHVTVGFTHGYSCSSPSGSMGRSNFFESHRSNKCLRSVTVMRGSALHCGCSASLRLKTRTLDQISKMRNGLR